MNNIGLNDTFNKVKDFHIAFGHPFEEKPKSMNVQRANARYSWMKEEIDEFLEAVENDDVVEQADAMIDVIYFAIGTLVEIGVQPQNLFDIVQNANMSKLWEDGKPRYREDGKILKPSNWIDPNPLLKQEVENQKSNLD